VIPFLRVDSAQWIRSNQGKELKRRGPFTEEDISHRQGKAK